MLQHAPNNGQYAQEVAASVVRHPRFEDVRHVWNPPRMLETSAGPCLAFVHRVWLTAVVLDDDGPSDLHSAYVLNLPTLAFALVLSSTVGVEDDCEVRGVGETLDAERALTAEDVLDLLLLVHEERPVSKEDLKWF